MVNQTSFLWYNITDMKLGFFSEYIFLLKNNVETNCSLNHVFFLSLYAWLNEQY